MTDESGQTYPYTIDTLLDRALGAEGYYGAFTANVHTDSAQSDRSPTRSSRRRSARGVPRRLGQADADLARRPQRVDRSARSRWNGGTLSFTVTQDASANGLQAMLPAALRQRAAARADARGRDGFVHGQHGQGRRLRVLRRRERQLCGHLRRRFDRAGRRVARRRRPGPAASLSALPSSRRFNEALDGVERRLRSTFVLRDAANALVSASVSYDSASRTATLRPAAALAGLDHLHRHACAAGRPIRASRTWPATPSRPTLRGRFTTAAAPPPPSCPCSAWSASATPTHAAAVGPERRSSSASSSRPTSTASSPASASTRATGNTGTHVGNLWSSGGTLLATRHLHRRDGVGLAAGELRDARSPVTANTVYVASYFAPNGNYAADTNFFASAGVDNGPVHLLQRRRRAAATASTPTARRAASRRRPSARRNYWVDVVFTTSGGAGPDTTPPTVSANDAGHRRDRRGGRTASVTATSARRWTRRRSTSSTFELRDAANALVPASVSYNAATRTATLTPTAALAAVATYTATVRGGGDRSAHQGRGRQRARGQRRLVVHHRRGAGTELPVQRLERVDDADHAAGFGPERGRARRQVPTDVDGFITGVRFYKGDGQHRHPCRQPLDAPAARCSRAATFSGETASGWQQVNFASPVPVTANTIYVASYYAPNGSYAADHNFFATSGVEQRPGQPAAATAPPAATASTATRARRRSRPRPSTRRNYWVDVVFSTTGTGPTRRRRR